MIRAPTLTEYEQLRERLQQHNKGSVGTSAPQPFWMTGTNTVGGYVPSTTTCFTAQTLGLNDGNS